MSRFNKYKFWLLKGSRVVGPRNPVDDRSNRHPRSQAGWQDAKEPWPENLHIGSTPDDYSIAAGETDRRLC